MATAPLVYRRRDPEKTLLYKVAQEHWATFVACAEAKGCEVPLHVQQEFDRYLTCGILAYGMARVQCSSCGYDRLVAFACKGRSVCPSCTSRRMAETAMLLVDEVFPAVPVRQWVLTASPPLRYRMASNSELCREVLRCATNAIFSWYRTRAKAEFGILKKHAYPAGVTFIQRFGSALNLNVHFHTLLCDGIFDWTDRSKPAFRALPAPNKGDIAAIAWDIAERVTKLLQKRGEYSDDAEDAFATEQPLLSACQSASVQGLIATGPRAGQQVLRFGVPIESPQGKQKVYAAHGFDLHANVRIPANDRKRLEKLCRYAARPALSTERLSKTADGRLMVELKRAWSDGTSHIVLRPNELLEKLVALVPPPRMHQVRYHAAFAPNAKIRSLIVPKKQRVSPAPVQLELFDKDGRPFSAAASAEGSKKDAQPCSRHIGWAKLMRRVFGIDVLQCPRCPAGRMQFISWLMDPDAIRAMLTSVGLATAPPTIAPARYEQLKFDFKIRQPVAA